MTVIIYGFRQSTCTHRVTLVCKKLGVDYEIKVVDITLTKMRQPFGMVPVLVANLLILNLQVLPLRSPL